MTLNEKLGANARRVGYNDGYHDGMRQAHEDLGVEIAALREGYASEARIVLAQTLDLRSLAKCRREILTAQVQRMARVALGQEEPRGCVRGRQTLEEYVERFLASELTAFADQRGPDA